MVDVSHTEGHPANRERPAQSNFAKNSWANAFTHANRKFPFSSIARVLTLEAVLNDPPDNWHVFMETTLSPQQVPEAKEAFKDITSQIVHPEDRATPQIAWETTREYIPGHITAFSRRNATATRINQLRSDIEYVKGEIGDRIIQRVERVLNNPKEHKALLERLAIIRGIVESEQGQRLSEAYLKELPRVGGMEWGTDAYQQLEKILSAKLRNDSDRPEQWWK